jgi:putative transposase
MTMCGVKFRAYPTVEQSKKLSQWIGCARVIYNCKVEEDKENYLRFKETGEKTLVNQSFAQFKTEERCWLKACPSQILRNSAVNWYISKQRFFKKLSANPTKKRKGDKDSVLLTRELFSFQKSDNPDAAQVPKLFIGTKTNRIGCLNFVAHRDYNLPKQIVVSKKNNQWFVSFCYEVEDIPEESEATLLQGYAALAEDALKELTVGIDRGIAIPFQLSIGKSHDLEDKAKERLLKKQRRLKRYQKKLARQRLGSNTRNKTKRKIGKLHTKIANIRHNFCHQVSHKLATSEAAVFAVEDLQLKNMTKAPKPKQNEQGQYIPNGAKAKAGLNRELLSKGLGKTISLLEYKARRRGKIVIKVPAHHSSQECALCGHIHPDNRKTQSEFFCLLCGNQDNADLNAAKVIAKRGIQFLLSKPQAKTRTRLGISRSKAGRGASQTQIRETLDAQAPMTPEAFPL